MKVADKDTFDSVFDKYKTIMSNSGSWFQIWNAIENSIPNIKTSDDETVDYYLGKVLDLAIYAAQIEEPRYAWKFLSIDKIDGFKEKFGLTDEQIENFRFSDQEKLKEYDIAQAPSMLPFLFRIVGENLYEPRHRQKVLSTMFKVTKMQKRARFEDPWLNFALIGKRMMPDCCTEILDFFVTQQARYPDDKNLMRYTIDMATRNAALINGAKTVSDDAGLATIWKDKAFVKQDCKPWKTVMLVNHGGGLISAYSGQRGYEGPAEGYIPDCLREQPNDKKYASNVLKAKARLATLNA